MQWKGHPIPGLGDLYPEVEEASWNSTKVGRIESDSIQAPRRVSPATDICDARLGFVHAMGRQ
ncbi:hypothetical protein DYST_00849 [Dyella terrae]|nr:hypothetical protein DYST_00849 [Dyella terrae]